MKLLNRGLRECIRWIGATKNGKSCQERRFSKNRNSPNRFAAGPATCGRVRLVRRASVNRGDFSSFFTPGIRFESSRRSLPRVEANRRPSSGSPRENLHHCPVTADTVGQKSVNTRSRLDACRWWRRQFECDRCVNRFVRQYERRAETASHSSSAAAMIDSTRSSIRSVAVVSWSPVRFERRQEKTTAGSLFRSST